MIPQRFQKLALASVISGCALVMTGCNDNDSDTNTGTTTPPVIEKPTLTDSQIAIYYRRDGENPDYEGWGLHVFDNLEPNELADGEATDWNAPLMPAGIHPTYGAYYIIDLKDPRKDQSINFIVHKGNDKNCGADQTYSVAALGEDAYVLENSCEVHDDPATKSLLGSDAAAHLVSAQHLLWNTPEGTDRVELLSAADGQIKDNSTFTDLVVPGMQRIELIDRGFAPPSSDYPAFNAMKQWELPDHITVDIQKEMLKGQLVVIAKDKDGKALQATSVQTPFAIDALYFTDELKNTELGAVFAGDSITLKLWAPTAKKVSVEVAESGEWDAAVTTHSMNYDNATGLWSFTSSHADLDRKFYRYVVEVYRRDTGKVETVKVTDPYSLNVSADGAFTHVVNLDDPDTQPAGWDQIPVNDGKRPTNITIWESHIRDFSNSDKNPSINPAYNGKYKAFTENDRSSVQHLKDLAQSGLTYYEMLPAFDIATVNETPEKVADLSDPFSKLCELNEAVQNSEFSGHCGTGETIGDVFETLKNDPEKPQALNSYLRMHDSFNWGYDPFHYTVPEGTFATKSTGIERIKEFREMVVALNGMGLNVAMDVVYNHTNAAGLAPKSVLDKIVPDYYQRLDKISGAVENSSCCSNTASEQKMMAKLMEDSLAVWVEDYKIDAFRFDLMGLHLKQNMIDIQTRLESINQGIYLYGEGWTMGFGGGAGVPENLATQVNMAGTDIGTFSDRLRDAARGGSPFDGGNTLRSTQGFASGAWGIRNELNGSANVDQLRNQTDLIRVGLAGNLADYQFTNYKGTTVKGSQVDYNGAVGGYTKSPMENVGYISKHDNQTFWDNTQYKLANELTPLDRTKMQILAQSLPILSQGVPFIHMGAEILRSKSMQRDSYDSGDWYNRVNFNLDDTEWSNNWNVGLPRKDNDGHNWDLIKNLIANAENIQPTAAEAKLSLNLTKEYLTIRRDSPLFQLQTAKEVQQIVKFHNTGVGQVDGLIVMELDNNKQSIQNDYKSIVVLFNATAEAKTFGIDGSTGYAVHPTHQHFTASGKYGSASFADGKFTVPARSTVVFVKE